MFIATPFDPAFPVICMDETPRQLISETREPIPAEPGRPARHDYEYRRCGTCNVFMAAEPLAGKRMTEVTQRRTKADWARFLADIADRYPSAIRITLVMDNLSSHRPWRTAYAPGRCGTASSSSSAPMHGRTSPRAHDPSASTNRLAKCWRRRRQAVRQTRPRIVQAKVDEFTTDDALQRLPTFNV